MNTDLLFWGPFSGAHRPASAGSRQGKDAETKTRLHAEIP